LIVAVALIAGRALGIGLMFFSIILVSLFTATVSSIFMAKKIQEAKGLELVTFENHILVCGWNELHCGHSSGSMLKEMRETWF
tara:strand:- start:1205 stop:1453 length:249 start_codon:yes stop_codon:yes gene_type:complete